MLYVVTLVVGGVALIANAGALGFRSRRTDRAPGRRPRRRRRPEPGPALLARRAVARAARRQREPDRRRRPRPAGRLLRVGAPFDASRSPQELTFGTNRRGKVRSRVATRVRDSPLRRRPRRSDDAQAVLRPVGLEAPSSGGPAGNRGAEPTWSSDWSPTARRRSISVVAPPGYGKTTLLAQWANARQSRVGWISADAHDNDPAVLLTYIAVALHRIERIDPAVFRSLTATGAGIKGPRDSSPRWPRCEQTGRPRPRSSRSRDEPGESRRGRRPGPRTAGWLADGDRLAGRVAAAGGATAFARRHRGDRGRRSGDGPRRGGLAADGGRSRARRRGRR